MIVSQERIEREVPNEPGATFEFVRVSWKVLRESRRKASLENLEIARVLGAEFVAAMQDDDPEKEARVRERLAALQYDESNFDAGVLLDAGLVGWSYPEDLNAENIDLLDEATVVWAKEQIISITKPPSEEEEKN